MTVEELLKPRWKVISNFPDSEFKVGSIEDRDWGKYANGEDETDGYLWRISEFPAIFKKLEWYEERDITDMPKYLKYHTGEIAKPILYENWVGVGLQYIGRDYLPNDWWSVALTIPATEEEYNNPNKYKITL